MCIGAQEGASGSAALQRAAPPHGPSALLASGPVTYVRYVMRNTSKQNQCLGIAQTERLSSTATRIVLVNLATLAIDNSGSVVSLEYTSLHVEGVRQRLWGATELLGSS